MATPTPTLDSLYRTYSGQVETFIRSRTGSPAVAQDITSQVFMDAATHLTRSKTANLSAGWLFTVARRRLIDHWRSSYRRDRLWERLRSAPETPTTVSPPEPTLDLTYLDALPPRQRNAIELRYLNDLTVGEVAEVMGESYGAVESLLARARRNARNTLTKQASMPC